LDTRSAVRSSKNSVMFGLHAETADEVILRRL